MTEAEDAGRGGAFRSLRNCNYRIWFAGALVSNVGAWMQRIAQDWLVLTVLTRHDAAAVGFVTALQFAPQVLLLPWTGRVADTFDRRRVLMITQLCLGLLALGLGLLTVTGLVRAWEVYGFALALGCVAAFDAPARTTFVGDMVGEADLGNAVALNATSFNASRLIGPAVAGLVIAAVGPGWAFLVNAGSFVAVLFSLMAMDAAALHRRAREPGADEGFVGGLRYVWARPDFRVLLLMLALFGTFGLNFPVFISTMAASVFHMDARGYGLLSSAMAVGSVTGALMAARRRAPTIRHIAAGAAVFGLAYAAAAVAPSPWLFAAAMVVVGAASQTVTTSTMGLVQMSTAPAMRGRVMALVLSVAFGGQPIGAPLMGWIANAAGPRVAIMVGAVAGLVVAALGARFVRGAGLAADMAAAAATAPADAAAGVGTL